MLNRLIEKAYKNIEIMDCCHTDGRKCYCYDCLKADFHGMPDEYNCPKKMNYYVAKYAASYASEFYAYLEESQILNRFKNKKLNILSLGCGFAPDYYAINKYINDHNLKISMFYEGLDNSPHWKTARPRFTNLRFILFDLTAPFDFDDVDLVIMSKVFSTLYKHDLDEPFIANLLDAVDTSMKPSALLIFNDINHRGMGRDAFDSHVKTRFSAIRRYYTENSTYFEPGWVKIVSDEMAFPIIENEEVDPLDEFVKCVYFEYRK